MLLGIHTLHINNIDHRDLKPANILMYENGEYAKIADLGLARNVEHSQVSLTKGIGTLRYWAPEQLKFKPAQYKSDMYSLGLILHFMMAKTLPDYDDHVETGKFEYIPAQYSKELYEMCAKLLQTKPEARPMARELFSLDIII